MELKPLLLSPVLNEHNIYEAHSSDGAVFTMSPKTKEVVLSWSGNEAGGFDLAAVAFFRGYDRFVMPIVAKDDADITSDEWRFVQDMAIAFSYCKNFLQPNGVVLH